MDAQGGPSHGGVGYTDGMLRIVVAVVVGADLVAATVRLFIVPRALVQRC